MDLKHRSRNITDGRDRAPARAMYKSIGFTDDDLAKPLIAIANTWIETMPCNFHLRRLSAKVKEGIRAAGGIRAAIDQGLLRGGVRPPRQAHSAGGRSSRCSRAR